MKTVYDSGGLRALSAKGMSLADIAEKTGLTVQAVSRCLQAAAYYQDLEPQERPEVIRARWVKLYPLIREQLREALR